MLVLLPMGPFLQSVVDIVVINITYLLLIIPLYLVMFSKCSSETPWGNCCCYCDVIVIFVVVNVAVVHLLVVADIIYSIVVNDNGIILIWVHKEPMWLIPWTPKTMFEDYEVLKGGLWIHKMFKIWSVLKKSYFTIAQVDSLCCTLLQECCTKFFAICTYGYGKRWQRTLKIRILIYFTRGYR